MSTNCGAHDDPLPVAPNLRATLGKAHSLAGDGHAGQCLADRVEQPKQQFLARDARQRPAATIAALNTSPDAPASSVRSRSKKAAPTEAVRPWPDEVS